jgi:trans-aconitate methyltransferase
MDNPWIHIIQDDYVGHMTSPNVNQRPVLNRLIKDELSLSHPHSLLVIGCSTGNGLEHIDPAVTSRVDCIDINPAFLQSLQDQFSHSPFSLSVHCIDVSQFAFDDDAYNLVHAALIFEYIEWQSLLPRIVRSLAPGSVLNVVIQLPSPSAPAVTPTQYTRLLALESVFQFVDPISLITHASNAGLTLDRRFREPLPLEKAFEILRFVKSAA